MSARSQLRRVVVILAAVMLGTGVLLTVALLAGVNCALLPFGMCPIPR